MSLRGVCAVVFIVMRGASWCGRLEEEIVVVELIWVVMLFFEQEGRRFVTEEETNEGENWAALIPCMKDGSFL